MGKLSSVGDSHESSQLLDLDKPDKATLEKVRFIVLVFSHAVSVMKIYPSHHTSVGTFRDELAKSLFAYLEDHDELAIEVEEDSFSFRGETVFQEEKFPRSLPFLFFKDGMRKLIFLRGLDEEALCEFLEIVRENALQATSQSDIVDALWERDFEFIRYSAPDEFIEAKISSKEDVFQDLRADKESFRTGRIELTPEDREEVRGKEYALGVAEGQENPELDRLVTALDGEESAALEALLVAERGHSAEEEFLDLLFELLFLEERPDDFQKILAFIEKHHLALVRGRDFSHAVRLLDQLKDLTEVLAGPSPERSKSLEGFILAAFEAAPLDLLDEALIILRPNDFPPFFEYLKRIGPRALRLGAKIFEADADEDVKAAAFSFLREVGRLDITLLAGLAKERNPELTQAIISILGDAGDKRALPLLAAFLTYRNTDVKVKAIRALSNFEDELASKIKIEFFQDPDARVRTAAAVALDPGKDLKALDVLLAAARTTKTLHGKSRDEKEAIFGGLGRSRAPEAVDALRTILTKRGVFAGARVDETRMAAAEALRRVGTGSAVEALEAGSKSRGRRVRAACRRALSEIRPGEAAP